MQQEQTKQRNYVPKRANLTTVLCFVKRKKYQYTLKDMHVIGKKLADLYRKQKGKDPLTIQQVEGRQIIVVNAFPYDFSKDIHKVVSEHFKSRKQ